MKTQTTIETTSNPGIDYSAGQPINRNLETGLRYGIIPQNSLASWSLEELFENGNDDDYDAYIESVKDSLKAALSDYFTESRLPAMVESAFDAISDNLGDNYQGTGDCTRTSYDQDGYKLQSDSSGDVWVFESPYFTYAQFCSPCAPGACYLRNPLESPNNANKCYCLGHDWFDSDSPCPYPVYSVETGLLVAPEQS